MDEYGPGQCPLLIGQGFRGLGAKCRTCCSWYRVDRCAMMSLVDAVENQNPMTLESMEMSKVEVFDRLLEKLNDKKEERHGVC